MKIFLSSLFALCTVSAFAQTIATDVATTSAATAAPRVSMAPRAWPPEAYVATTNYILVVNHDSVVAPAWLDEHSDYMRSQLGVGVTNVVEGGEIGADARAFVANIRAKHDGRAKMVIVISGEKGVAPVLASPYEYWGIMDANWVKAGGGDDDTQNLRMGKRIFQTLGHVIGAGHRMEHEAVMRYTPTPRDIDDALSRGFHPLNSVIFETVRKGAGLDQRRLRPMKDLIDEGIFKPRLRPAATNAPVGEASLN